ncbi:hypothetical protein [Rubritalea tangerina]|uniref:hypothetical protein n=1 Tax=Rubritalea tangerina TaxID=430798 RepID=UPI0036083A2A
MLNAPNLRVGCPPFLTTPHFLMISTFLLNRAPVFGPDSWSLIYLSLDFISGSDPQCPIQHIIQ